MSRFSSQVSGKKGRGPQRSLVGIALGAAALVVLPAAIAFACVPASSIGFDKQGYKYNAGDSVTVTGRGFRADTPVVMRLQAPGSATSSTVGDPNKKTDSSGGFTDSFGLASDVANGDYVVSVTVGTSGARETFTVEPRAAAPVTPTPVSSPPQESTEPGTVPPPEASPTESPESGNTEDATAARKKAVRNCKKKFSNKKARTSGAKRRIAKKRSRCIKRAQKQFA